MELAAYSLSAASRFAARQMQNGLFSPAVMESAVRLVDAAAGATSARLLCRLSNMPGTFGAAPPFKPSTRA